MSKATTASHFLRVIDVAKRWDVCVRTIHERTRTRTIPFRRFPHTRACLFLEEELLAFEQGAELLIDERNGGVYVRPVPQRGENGARTERGK